MHNGPWEWAWGPTKDFACIRGPISPILWGGKGETAGASMARQQFTTAQRMGGLRRQRSMAERKSERVERSDQRRSSSVARRRGRTR